MTRVAVVAEMVGRDLARRRAVLGLLALLPMAFYLARRDQTGQAIRFASLGVAWAMSTAALFSGIAGKGVEPRLRLSGYRTADLYLGRTSALLAVGLALAAGYFALIALDQDVARLWAVGVGLGLTVLVAVPLGLLLSSVVPRDLEGMLLLITVVGVQFVLDPASGLSELLPFWSTRELGTYAVDAVDDGYLRRGLFHGLVTSGALLLATAALAAVRLRRRGHLRVPGAARGSTAPGGR